MSDCPYCKEWTEAKTVGKYKIDILQGYDYYLDNEAKHESSSKLILIINKILHDYLDDKITIEQIKLLSMNSYGSKKAYTIKIQCNKCFHTYTETTNFQFTYEVYSSFNQVFKDEFYKAFGEIYKCDAEFILKYVKYNDVQSLSYILFQKDDIRTTKLRKLDEIRSYIPIERGGEPQFNIDLVLETVIISIFSNIVYDILKYGIKKISIVIKGNLRKLSIKRKLEEEINAIQEFCGAENIHWDKELAVKIVEEKVQEIVQEYIKRIEDKNA